MANDSWQPNCLTIGNSRQLAAAHHDDTQKCLFIDTETKDISVHTNRTSIKPNGQTTLQLQLVPLEIVINYIPIVFIWCTKSTRLTPNKLVSNLQEYDLTTLKLKPIGGSTKAADTFKIASYYRLAPAIYCQKKIFLEYFD